MTKRTKETIPVEVAFDEWHKNPEYMREYDALKKEFALARQFIMARGSWRLDPTGACRSYGDLPRPYCVAVRRQDDAIDAHPQPIRRSHGHRVVINFEPIAAS